MVRPAAHALTPAPDNLRHHLRRDLLDIVRAGIATVDAVRLVERALTPEVCSDAGGGVRVIAAGKAAPAMALAAARTLGGAIGAGLVIAPFDSEAPDGWEVIRGGHPVPTAGSEQAGARALAFARSLPDDALLLVLLSGGASAVMAAPAEGISLEDKRETTARLLRAGADIHALNTVRKHLSGVKGGQLAAAAGGRVLTLAISDVVGDDLSVIGSGPTVADPSTFADALALIERYGGADGYPRAIRDRLAAGARGEIHETPKPGDLRLSRATTRVIGGRSDAMRGAEQRALALGYTVIRIVAPVIGEARNAAVAHLDSTLPEASRLVRPACIISSGETTVRVTGSGRGGRNQEFALAAVPPLASAPSVAAMLASVGTDGIDGPTDAAGAIADWTTLERMRTDGLGEPADFLRNNNTYEAFSRLGDLIHTGPTGTNVGDLQVVLIG